MAVSIGKADSILPTFIKYCDFAAKYFPSEMFCWFVYWVPVSVTSQLNVVRVPVFDAAVKVSVAWIICPAFRTVFCRFHVRVSEELALVGLQLFAVIVSVSGMLPVFLIDFSCDFTFGFWVWVVVSVYLCTSG